MDTTNAPQLIEHLQTSLTFTPYEVRWIPQSAKFVLCGQQTNATGSIYIYQLQKTALQVVKEISHQNGVKCGTFDATVPEKSDLAFGDFKGELNILDLTTGQIYYCVKAHEAIVNAIDGTGGNNVGYGAPEIVTGGRDGCVRVWDPRQKGPVVSLEPAETDQTVADAWCVAQNLHNIYRFGGNFNAQEKSLVAGYDNGDVKLFDLRKNELLYETNLRNGVCGIQFDRKDIQQNKMIATTLEGKFHMFDLRTLHPEDGYSCKADTGFKATVWGVRHLPQNREIFALQGGDGAISIYKYNYPTQRVLKDMDGRERGVVGTAEILNNR